MLYIETPSKTDNLYNEHGWWSQNLLTQTYLYGKHNNPIKQETPLISTSYLILRSSV